MTQILIFENRADL